MTANTTIVVAENRRSGVCTGPINSPLNDSI
jgi:hypothetical protein